MRGSEQGRIPAFSGPTDYKGNDNNKSLHWLSANYVLSSLHKLALLSLKNSYSHFTSEETEAPGSKAAR